MKVVLFVRIINLVGYKTGGVAIMDIGCIWYYEKFRILSNTDVRRVFTLRVDLWAIQ